MLRFGDFPLIPSSRSKKFPGFFAGRPDSLIFFLGPATEQDAIIDTLQFDWTSVGVKVDLHLLGYLILTIGSLPFYDRHF
jgi:hypothetical protein